jgi:hypothetical protein
MSYDSGESLMSKTKLYDSGDSFDGQSHSN